MYMRKVSTDQIKTPLKLLVFIVKGNLKDSYSLDIHSGFQRKLVTKMRLRLVGEGGGAR